MKPERHTFIRNFRESRGPIYLALHGETEWNQQRRFQGRLDSPLTETGLEQARRAGVTQDHQAVEHLNEIALALDRQACRKRAGIHLAAAIQLN